MASSCPCQAGAGALGPCLAVQVTLQSDPSSQCPGTHSTPQKDPSVAPAYRQVSGPSMGHAAVTPQLLQMEVRAQHLELARNAPLRPHTD